MGSRRVIKNVCTSLRQDDDDEYLPNYTYTYLLYNSH